MLRYDSVEPTENALKARVARGCDRKLHSAVRNAELGRMIMHKATRYLALAFPLLVSAAAFSQGSGGGTTPAGKDGGAATTTTSSAKPATSGSAATTAMAS